MWQQLVFVVVCVACWVQGQSDPPIVQTPTYAWYCTGNCDVPARSPVAPTFGVVLMGGSTDVDSAYLWMCEKAGGGDWLVLRTHGDGAYNPYIYDLCQSSPYPMNSVSTLVLHDRASAFEDFVVERTRNASALWFAGGDQWTYYHYWKGSPLQTALTQSVYTTRPIGGTSAGNAIQGEYVYSAQFDSTTSFESLRNPYDSRVTIGTNYLGDSVLANLITDTHFAQRDRMGRLVTFVSRLAADSWAPLAAKTDSDPSKHNCASSEYGARGIGVDEETALLIEADGTVSITSWTTDGSAYLLCLDHAPRACEPDLDLDVSGIAVTRLTGNGTAVFDLQSWTVLDKDSTASYELDARDGRLDSTQRGGSIY